MTKNHGNDSFESIGKFKTSTLHAHGVLRLGFLYNQKNWWKKCLLVIFAATLIAFANLLFLKNTGLYSAGIGGVAQGIARIVQTALTLNGKKANTVSLVFNLMFWFGVAAFNIPLFIFGWLKISRQFALLTGLYIISSSVIGIGISYIPKIDTIFLLGPVQPTGFIHGDDVYANIFLYHHIDNMPFFFNSFPSNLQYLPEIVKYTNSLNGPAWPSPAEASWYKDLIFNQAYDPYKSSILILYSVIYGVIISVCYSMLYIVGSSTGGSDFVTVFFSAKKSRPLGGIMIIINTSLLVIGFTMGNFISGGMVCGVAWNFEFFLSANLIASFISILINGVLLNGLFPINKFTKIEVISNKIQTIKKKLFDSKFQHSITISKNTGAYSNKDVEILWTVCTYIEIPKLINIVRSVDKKAMIIVETVRAVDGPLKLYKIGAND